MFTPSGPGFHERALRRSAAVAVPWLLKPMRLMTARCSGRRNKRGFGLPGWGFGVTVPISTAEKPQANSPSTASASLSSPAASATGWANFSPASSTDRSMGARRSVCSRMARQRAFHFPRAASPDMPSRCAGSGGRLKSNARVRPYMRQAGMKDASRAHASAWSTCSVVSRLLDSTISISRRMSVSSR
ncbi:hypothetical protein COEX109129_40390 [Corallococcus exiguus]